MAAITWRNIEAPDLRGAGALINQATAGATAMGNALTNAMATYQQEQQRATDFRKNENTNKFLNSLYSQFTTPEALQEAISSGAIGQQLAGFGSEIDHAQVRGAAEKLLGERQQRALTSMDFQNKSIDNADAPLLAQADALSLAGKSDEANAIRAQVNARNQGKAAQTIFANQGLLTNREREGTKFGWEADAEKHKQALRPYEVEAAALKPAEARARIASSNASANASNASAAASNMRTQMMKYENNKMMKADSAEQFADAAASNYRKMQGDASKRVFDEATKLKMDIPLDSAGRPDWTRASKDNITQLQANLGNDIVNKATAGDTLAYDAMYQMAADKFGSRAADAAFKNVGERFNTGPATPRGSDVIRAERESKALQAEATRLKEEYGGYSTMDQSGDARELVIKTLKDAGVKGSDLTKLTTQAMSNYKPQVAANGTKVWPDLQQFATYALENADSRWYNPFTWSEDALARSYFGGNESVKAKVRQRELDANKRKLQEAASKSR